MDKKKSIFTKTFGMIGLILFAFAAMSSTSSSESTKKTIRDGVNGFIDGWEMSGARGSIEIKDSVLNADHNQDFALNDKKSDE